MTCMYPPPHDAQGHRREVDWCLASHVGMASVMRHVPKTYHVQRVWGLGFRYICLGFNETCSKDLPRPKALGFRV